MTTQTGIAEFRFCPSPLEVERANEVVDVLMEYEFKTAGRAIDNQIDCLGVLIEVYRQAFGIELPDPACGTKDEILTTEFFKLWEPIEKPEDGCAVEYKRRGGVHHVGLWLSEKVIHATRNGMFRLSRDRLGLPIDGFFRYIGPQ